MLYEKQIGWPMFVCIGGADHATFERMIKTNQNNVKWYGTLLFVHPDGQAEGYTKEKVYTQ
jgi:hypothetical protein